MKFKIIADSSCDLSNNYFETAYQNKEVGLEVVPFTVRVDDVDYVDDETLDKTKFMQSLDKCKTASSSCPSPQLFEEACTADFNFIVTISSKLSGSYNSALVASQSVENEVFVIDSMGAAGMETLLVERLFELINLGFEFSAIKSEIITYRDNLSLFFNLTTYDNFVRKGRINVYIAKIVSIARIKLLCKAKDGDIAVAKKSFTYNQCIRTIVQEAQSSQSQLAKRKCIITYCECLDVAEKLAKNLEELNIFDKIVLDEGRGLNSFYALKNSVIVSYD